MSKHLILFTSQGCGPCQQIKNNLSDYESEYGITTQVFKIDSTSEQGKKEASDFKYATGVPQSFAMFTPGLVIQEIPSGLILAQAEGGQANNQWIVNQLEIQHQQAWIDVELVDPLPPTIAPNPILPSVITGLLFDVSTMTDNGLDRAKNEFNAIFGNTKKNVSIGLQIVVLLVSFFTLYLLVRYLHKQPYKT